MDDVTTPGGAAIVVRGLARRYPTADAVAAPALRGVSLDVAAGQVVAVSGPSGSGKSTLLHLVGGMDRPDAGTVHVGGVAVHDLDRAAQAAYRRTVGFVFQRFHLLPALTVLDNVLAPVLPYRTPYDKTKRARRLLRAVGLDGKERRLPARLSGGEQQRVAIARALVNDPRLLLADEPTGNLDSVTGADVLDLLLSLRDTRGTTVLIATHDPQVVDRCDTTVHLRDGMRVDAAPRP